jgi:hypothetical protein
MSVVAEMKDVGAQVLVGCEEDAAVVVVDTSSDGHREYRFKL